MTRVLITEAVHASLAPLAGFDLEVRDGLWQDRLALLQTVGNCAGLIVRNQTVVDRELISAAPLLCVVGRLGSGLDNLDLAELEARSIAVVNAPGLNARAVAEYVLAACLDLSRRLAYSDRQVRAGGWPRNAGFELREQPVGVIGLGATGAATAQLLRDIGMEVGGYDPFLPIPSAVRRFAFTDLLKWARIVTIHVPLTDATRGMIGPRQIALMPRGAMIVNAARGGVVDEAALLGALESGHLGGAALDVRHEEPPRRPDAFAKRDDVLLTPHLGGLTEESLSAVAAHVLSGVRDALSQARQA